MIAQRSDFVRKLNARIRGARNVDALGRTWDQLGDAMNGIHLSTFCIQLSRLKASTKSFKDAKRVFNTNDLLKQVLDAVVAKTSLLDEQGVSNVLYSVAKLGYYDAAAVEHLLHEAYGRMPRFSGQELSNMLWAVGVLRHYPGEQWLAAFLSAAHRLLPSLSDQSLSNLMWALGELSVLPNEAWMSSFLAAVRAAAPTFKPMEFRCSPEHSFKVYCVYA